MRMLVQLMTSLTLTSTIVSCYQLHQQHPSPLDPASHQSRRLHATYYSGDSELGLRDGDDDDDGRWLLMGAAAAAAAAGLTSLITAFALCNCCPPYRTRRRCVRPLAINPLMHKVAKMAT